MHSKLKSFLLLMVALTNYGFVTDCRPNEYIPVMSNDSDFKSIKNIDGYAYWECIYNPNLFVSSRSGQQMVAHFGNIKYSKYAKNTFSAAGFFSACGPAFCSYYIVAVKKDKSIKLINTPDEFRKFIGRIDNLEEAKLTARNAGYIFSTSPKYSPMYTQSDNKYIFKLYDFGLQSCLPPVQNEPIPITITVDQLGSISRI